MVLNDIPFVPYKTLPEAAKAAGKLKEMCGGVWRVCVVTEHVSSSTATTKKIYLVSDNEYTALKQSGMEFTIEYATN